MINDVVMAKRDVRVGRMSELLSAIKLIKSNAWVRLFWPFLFRALHLIFSCSVVRTLAHRGSRLC